jgi:hypothetical protein
MLSSFTGTVNDDQVLLSWTTGDEWNHTGFHIHRSSPPGASPTRLTSHLITATSPGRYTFTDNVTGFAPGQVVTYQLSAVDRTGREEIAGRLNVHLPPAREAWLANPAPNPSRGPGTVLAFSTSVPGPVRLSVFDAAGREVRRLLDGERSPGHHIETWDGRDAGGSSLPAGIYFVRLASGSIHRTSRVMIAP